MLGKRCAGLRVAKHDFACEMCRAWQICSGCVADDHDEGALQSSMFKESFGYLFGRLKTLSQPPNADLGQIPDNMVPLDLPKPLTHMSGNGANGS